MDKNQKTRTVAGFRVAAHILEARVGIEPAYTALQAAA